MDEILWEAIKAFGPAFVAWGLAVITSKQNSKSEREKILEQLEKTKQNNIEAQNQSYKLQFCLSELEKKDRLYEELISDINIVIQSTERFRNPNLNEQNIAVITAANDALKQLHTVMFNAGSLTSLIKATDTNFKQYEQILLSLQKQGTNIERILHFLITGLRTKIPEQKFDSNYDQKALVMFEQSLISMQSFIMGTIMKLFDEMG